MNKLVLSALVFSLFFSQTLCQQPCLESCNTLYTGCVKQSKNFLDYQQNNKCQGKKLACQQLCGVEEFQENTENVESKQILTDSSKEYNMMQCLGQCKKDMFKCQIGCKSLGAKCNFDCDSTYRNCLVVQCQS